MKNISNILIIFLLGIIQITLVPYFGIRGLWPNLIFLLAISLILIDAEQEAYLTASFGGLILDLVSPIFFGFNVLVLMALIGLTQLLIKKFLGEINFLIALLVFIVAVFLHNLIFAFASHQFSWSALIINVVVSTFIGLIVFYIVNIRLKRRSFERF